MKNYIQPSIKVVELEGQVILQAVSGPGIDPNGNITGPQRSPYNDYDNDFFTNFEVNDDKKIRF